MAVLNQKINLRLAVAATHADIPKPNRRFAFVLLLSGPFSYGVPGQAWGSFY